MFMLQHGHVTFVHKAQRCLHSVMVMRVDHETLSTVAYNCVSALHTCLLKYSFRMAPYRTSWVAQLGDLSQKGPQLIW